MIHEPRPNNADNVNEVDESPPHHDPPTPLFNTSVASSALDLLRSTQPLAFLTAWWLQPQLHLSPHSIALLELPNTL